jgi:hypothetical protein
MLPFFLEGLECGRDASMEAAFILNTGGVINVGFRGKVKVGGGVWKEVVNIDYEGFAKAMVAGGAAT